MRCRSLAAPLAMLALCGSGALFAQTAAESQYRFTKDSAIRALTARAKRREAFATLSPAHTAALKDLEGRLRVIVGPFQAKGFPDPSHINTDDLFPDDEGSGGLDGLVYETADHRSRVVVTTRSLLATWLRQAGRGIPRDPITAFGVPDFYTFAIVTDAAVYKYATIPVADASRLGVVAAMLVLRAQDIGPFTPDEIVVSVARGSRVFIVIAPSGARIDPPRACLAMRDSIGGDAADVAYRGCYGARVPREPAFQKIVAQVQAIVAVLPPR